MQSVTRGDCLAEVPKQRRPFDLVYVDPPFFTQRSRSASTRDGRTRYLYEDRWASLDQYLQYMRERLHVMREALTSRGSLIYHCDRRTSHHARLLLDDVFGASNFRSEIIWTYRRWSNAQRGLLPAHQNLYWYSKSADYIFNTHYEENSPSTNVDQILQSRQRDKRDKSVYKRDAAGNTVADGSKPGVPLSDVWDIPFLNPKARERVGYPTQKPVALLARVISLWTSRDSRLLDPFCGSGTSLVAAKLAGRSAVGIDISEEATQLCRERLEHPVVSRSRVAEVGREQYRKKDQSWRAHLGWLEVTPVQRNRFVDAILSEGHAGQPVLLRVQHEGESLAELSKGLARAAKKRRAAVAFLITTEAEPRMKPCKQAPSVGLVKVIRAPALEITEYLRSLSARSLTGNGPGRPRFFWPHTPSAQRMGQYAPNSQLPSPVQLVPSAQKTLVRLASNR